MHAYVGNPSHSQHDFVQTKSINTYLLLFTNRIYESFKNGNQMDVIFTDLSKAFDTVDHEILLNKLSLNERLLGKQEF